MGRLADLTEEQQRLLLSYVNANSTLLELQARLSQLKFSKGIEDFYLSIRDVNTEFEKTVSYGESLREIMYQAFGGASERVEALATKVEDLVEAQLLLAEVGAEQGFSADAQDMYEQYQEMNNQVSELTTKLQEMQATYDYLVNSEDF